jgi:hypothetical protein
MINLFRKKNFLNHLDNGEITEILKVLKKENKILFLKSLPTHILSEYRDWLVCSIFLTHGTTQKENRND